LSVNGMILCVFHSIHAADEENKSMLDIYQVARLILKISP